MYVEASGTARIQVNNTGKVVTIAADSLDWDCEGDGERGMGPELVHSAEWDVDGHVVRWSVWEYPIGVENMKDTHVPAGLTMLQDIDYGLVHEREDD